MQTVKSILLMSIKMKLFIFPKLFDSKSPKFSQGQGTRAMAMMAAPVGIGPVKAGL